ncbi:hypothetical protein GGI21_005922 [Coemansia aciculifera]|nr:hypothetical protein GGI21_005922 [Coemansia aciculifera]
MAVTHSPICSFRRSGGNNVSSFVLMSSAPCVPNGYQCNLCGASFSTYLESAKHGADVHDASWAHYILGLEKERQQQQQ